MRFLVLLLLLGCSTDKIYTQQPLFDQRLAPRPGYVGLTNQVCLKKESGKCVEKKVDDHDLTDSAVRERLSDLKFICNVGGVRYRIAKDYPHLYSSKCKTKWFQEKCEYKWISIEYEYQKLLDANTVCAAQDSEFGRSLFTF